MRIDFHGRNAPVVFLTFSNDQDAHLPLLEEEAREIYGQLEQYHDRQNIEIYHTPSAEINDLFRQISRYGNRIAVFHFAGHANSTSLLLQNQEIEPKGLAKLLVENATDHLKLVVLNGCATEEQVNFFLREGVQAVIATSVPISDSMAKDFAVAFYHRLAQRNTLKVAFDKAIAFLQTKYKDAPPSQTILYRSLARRATALTYIPWTLYVNEDKKEVLSWKLPRPPKYTYFLLALIGFLVVGIWGVDYTYRTQEFSLSIEVATQKESFLDELLRDNSYSLKIIADNFEQTQPIYAGGRATFVNIPGKLVNSKVRFKLINSLASSNFALRYLDSLYQLKKFSPIQLAVDLVGIDVADGEVIDSETSRPIPHVQICIKTDVDTITICGRTDSLGRFYLEIPEMAQDMYYEITAEKDGYEFIRIDNNNGTKPMTLPMTPNE